MLSYVIICNHMLSYVIICYHILSCVIICYHIFSYIIIILIRLWEWSPLLVNRGTGVALIDNVHSDMARFNDGDDDDGNDDDDDDDVGDDDDNKGDNRQATWFLWHLGHRCRGRRNGAQRSKVKTKKV